MCPDTLAVHCVCPFCNQPIAAIDDSPLYGSNAYNRRVLHMLRPWLAVLIRDRDAWRARAADLARIVREDFGPPELTSGSDSEPELGEASEEDPLERHVAEGRLALE